MEKAGFHTNLIPGVDNNTWLPKTGKPRGAFTLCNKADFHEDFHFGLHYLFTSIRNVQLDFTVWCFGLFHLEALLSKINLVLPHSYRFL